MKYEWKQVNALKYWCYKVLPLVYDESLSYYELLNKVVFKLNQLIENNDKIPEYVASLVEDFITSGAIGEVVNDILSGYAVNVKYPPNDLTPASGDGTTDDTEAIQGCIDYVAERGGGSVYLPSGKYLTGSITVKGNVGLHGDNRYGSVMVLKGGASSALINGTCDTLSISKIGLDGNGANQVNSLNVVDVTVGSGIFENVRITGGNILLKCTADDLQVCDAIFDVAYTKAMDITYGALECINAIIKSVRMLNSGYCGFALNGNNAKVSAYVGDSSLNKLFTLSGNNNVIDVCSVNSTVYTDSGSNNSIMINGKVLKLGVTGNIDITGGNINVNATKTKVTGGQLEVDTTNPIKYGTPTVVNPMFKGVDMVASDGTPYQLLVANDLDVSSGFVSYLAFGGVNDGVTDNTEIMEDFFDYIDENGLIGYIEGGIYVLNSKMVHDVANAVDVICANTAVIRAGSNFPHDKLVQFTCLDPNGMVHFTWKGGTLIGENVPNSDTGEANDLMYITLGDYSTRTIIEGVTFSTLDEVLDRELTESDTANGFAHGDSGLFITSNNAVVKDCNFYTFPDSGMYASGGGDTLNYHDLTVTGCYFFGCGAGMTDKRERKRTFLDGNTFDYCQIGYSSAEGGAPGQIYTDPATDLIVSNNMFKNFRAGLNARKTDGAIITGNRFVEFGDSSEPDYPGAIQIQGSKNCIISNNYFDISNAVFTGHCRGIFVTTRDAVVSTGTIVSGNKFVGKLPSVGGYNVRGIEFYDASNVNYTLTTNMNDFIDVAVPFSDYKGVTGDFHNKFETIDDVFYYLNGELINKLSSMRTSTERGLLTAGGTKTLTFPDNAYSCLLVLVRNDSYSGIVGVSYWETSGTVLAGTGLDDVTISKEAGSRTFTITNGASASFGYTMIA